MTKFAEALDTEERVIGIFFFVFFEDILYCGCYARPFVCMYTTYLPNVSKYFFPLLFADDTDLFHTDKDIKVGCNQVNGD